MIGEVVRCWPVRAGYPRVFRVVLRVFRGVPVFRVANFEMHTTRIFAVKIRVANFEMHTTRIFAVKIRVANFEFEQPGFLQYENPSCKCKL